MKVLVLMDTNALLMMMERTGLFECIEESLETKPIYACTESVVKELEEIKRRGGPLSWKASLALEKIVPACRILSRKASNTDDDIVENAIEARDEGYHVIVATSDRDLRKKLRKHGIPTAYYRESQRRFELDYKPLL